MATWEMFAAAQPDLAARGEHLLMINNLDAPTLAGLAYFATVRSDGGPRIHPISPALIDGRLYAFIVRASPKCRDLHRNGQYALHNFPHFVEPMSWDNCTDEEEAVAPEHETSTHDPRSRRPLCRNKRSQPCPARRIS